MKETGRNGVAASVAGLLGAKRTVFRHFAESAQLTTTDTLPVKRCFHRMPQTIEAECVLQPRQRKQKRTLAKRSQKRNLRHDTLSDVETMLLFAVDDATDRRLQATHHHVKHS